MPPADYPVWTVHITDLPSVGGRQACARCGEAIADQGVTWPRGRMLAIRWFRGRQEIRLIDARDDLLEDETPCGDQ